MSTYRGVYKNNITKISYIVTYYTYGKKYKNNNAIQECSYMSSYGWTSHWSQKYICLPGAREANNTYMGLMSHIREASKVTINISYFHPAHQHYTDEAQNAETVVRYCSMAFRSYWALYRMSHCCLRIVRTLTACSLSTLAMHGLMSHIREASKVTINISYFHPANGTVKMFEKVMIIFS
jgi:hypothetical protein